MLGGAKLLNRKEVHGLNETMRTRNLRLPGAPGQVKNLEELSDTWALGVRCWMFGVHP